MTASALGLNLQLLCCMAVYPLWDLVVSSSGSVPWKDVVCAAASLTDVTHGSQQSKGELRGHLGWDGVRLTRVK